VYDENWKWNSQATVLVDNKKIMGFNGRKSLTREKCYHMNDFFWNCGDAVSKQTKNEYFRKKCLIVYETWKEIVLCI